MSIDSKSKIRQYIGIELDSTKEEIVRTHRKIDYEINANLYELRYVKLTEPNQSSNKKL